MKIKKLRLKVRSIGSAAVMLALCGAAVYTLSAFLLHVAAGEILAVSIVIFGAMYAAARIVVRRFFIYKIKPLYQIITAKDISTGILMEKYAGKDDIVNDVREELTHWADRKSDEIAALKANERYRKEFLGNVSHEIKTPVFTIQGYILTLLDGALEEPGINRLYLERAEKNIDRLINILSDIDEIYKLESGEMVLELRRFDVVALARDIADSLELDAERSSITLKVNASAALSCMVYADRNHIGQVLVNLITNSIKYGRPGGRTGINFIDMDQKIVVEVQDNGIGIEEKFHPRIFERFYRVDKSRSREQGGTGLGLAIVKHIIEAHGEKISMRSEPGKGTTFSFTLAKAPQASDPKQAKA